jgi:hypothetical protein
MNARQSYRLSSLKSQLKEEFDSITGATTNVAPTVKTGTSPFKTAFASFNVDENEREGSLNGSDEEFDSSYQVPQMDSLKDEEM